MGRIADLKEIFINHSEKIEVKRKTVLLEEGEICKQFYFIEKGCLRMSFNKDGKDITFQFFFEDQGVGSVESLKSGIPSLFRLETIENCTLYVMNKEQFFRMLSTNQILQEKTNEILFERFYHYQKLFLSRIKDSPEERYQRLLEEYPQIVQRVPQHYIASYLGITSVSLSRIRNRKS
jgi:CRP-like cAMP-binding protein